MQRNFCQKTTETKIEREGGRRERKEKGGRGEKGKGKRKINHSDLLKCPDAVRGSRKQPVMG